MFNLVESIVVDIKVLKLWHTTELDDTRLVHYQVLFGLNETIMLYEITTTIATDSRPKQHTILSMQYYKNNNLMSPGRDDGFDICGEYVIELYLYSDEFGR